MERADIDDDIDHSELSRLQLGTVSGRHQEMMDTGRNLIKELIELNGDVRELQKSAIVGSHIAQFQRPRRISIKHSKAIDEVNIVFC